MKALNPTTPRSGELFHFAGVARHDAAPQPEVGDRGSLERRALAVELARVHGAGRRVQRHVEEHRPAARCQRPAAGSRTFPLGAPRFVEVQMDVDHGREHVQPASVDLFGPAGKFRSDRLNPAVFNGNVLAPQALRRHQRAASYDQTQPFARSS